MEEVAEALAVEVVEALEVEDMVAEDISVDAEAIEVDIEEVRLEGEEAVVEAVAEDIIQVIIKISLFTCLLFF